jgi:hypothetical protein
MTGGNEAPPSELGVFVAWPDAQQDHERILAHIRRRFDLRRVYEIRWTREVVLENYTRFLGGSYALPAPTLGKAPSREHPILLMTVVDHSPRHQLKSTSRGTTRINERFLDTTREIQGWTGAGTMLHGSLSAAQATRDLVLLLGTDPKEHLYENPQPWNGSVEQVHRDLSGAHGWSSPTELFHALNHTVRYIVMRNFERLPDCLHVGSHEDVDILTDDYREILAVMNAYPNVRCIPRWGGPYWVRIAGHPTWFDVRYVGDRYYDPRWARAMLDRRVWNAGGFFSPNEEDYLESLAYHAVVHKRAFSPDYKERLASMARSRGLSGWEVERLEDPAAMKALLDDILTARRARYCRPRDVNVFYNFEATGHRWPHLRRKLAGVFRKGVRAAHRVGQPLGVQYREAQVRLHEKAPWLASVLLGRADAAR